MHKVMHKFIPHLIALENLLSFFIVLKIYNVSLSLINLQQVSGIVYVNPTESLQHCLT